MGCSQLGLSPKFKSLLFLPSAWTEDRSGVETPRPHGDRRSSVAVPLQLQPWPPWAAGSCSLLLPRTESSSMQSSENPVVELSRQRALEISQKPQYHSTRESRGVGGGSFLLLVPSHFSPPPPPRRAGDGEVQGPLCLQLSLPQETDSPRCFKVKQVAKPRC